MNPKWSNGWRVAVVVAVVFLLYWVLEDLLRLSDGYRGIFERYDYWVPRSLRSLLEIGLVLVAVCLIHRLGPRDGFRELGLRGPALRSLGLMALAVAPMWIVFAFTAGLDPEFSAPEVFYLALLSPFAEELVFRGFAFGQLWLRARWDLWPALVVSSLAFGYGHAADASSLAEGAGLLLLTGAGAVLFGWLFSRWRTLLAPLALHVLMNLAWNIWSVGDSALAGWMPTALQLLTAVLAIVLTVWAGRRGWLPPKRSRQQGGSCERSP